MQRRINLLNYFKNLYAAIYKFKLFGRLDHFYLLVYYNSFKINYTEIQLCF